jgi:hypothetical protein
MRLPGRPWHPDQGLPATRLLLRPLTGLRRSVSLTQHVVIRVAWILTRGPRLPLAPGAELAPGAAGGEASVSQPRPLPPAGG